MSNISGINFDIKKYSIHDGPGIRTTVFFKGCPLRCLWCQNPESQSQLPELILRTNRCINCYACEDTCPHHAAYIRGTDATSTINSVTDRAKCQVCGQCVKVCFTGAREIIGQRMTVGDVIREIECDRTFYDQSGGGVTFSGGEPLMQPEYLLALLKECKAIEIHTALDTSGYAPIEIISQLTQLVDLFLYDLKFVNEPKHEQYTGVSNRSILNNLQWLSAKGEKIIVRIPLIPGINDTEADLNQAGTFLSSLPNLPEVEIIPYHAFAEKKYEGLGLTYQLSGLKSPSHEQVANTIDLLKSYGLTVGSTAVSLSGGLEDFYVNQ